MNSFLEQFLEEKSLSLIERVSKGYSSEVFLVENSKKERFALKLEKEKSPRINMAEKESSFLKKANSLGIGPKLLAFSLEKRVILMEYIEGKTFSDWLFSSPSKSALKKFIDSLLSQAKELDKEGLSHGQLSGKGKNILVRKGLPVIIDFEKASLNRKCNNYNQIQSLLFQNPNSTIAKKVGEIYQLNS